MNAPFLGIGLCFALGIIAQNYGVSLVRGYSLVVLAGIVALWFLRGKRLFLPLFMVLLALTGTLRAQLAEIRPANAVENFISRYRIELSGKVISQPDVKKRGRRVMASFVVAAESVRTGARRYKKERAAAGNVQVFWIQPAFIPEAGDRVRLSGRLEKPRSALNPGEFDHAKYLSQKNIFVLLQPVGYRSGRLIAKAASWDLEHWIGKARTRLAALIDRLYSFPQSAILKALVLGVRSDVGPVIQNAFMKTGTVHLLAISGLNITMIAGSFFLVFLFLKLPRKVTAFLTMAVVTVYVPLAGLGIPVQRAGIMALVVLAAIFIGRQASLFNALCAAFFLILWMDPKSLWNVGFQLSFLSVLSLIAVLPLFPRHKLLSLSIGGSVAVLAGTFPVVLYYFNTFSPVGVVANLAAIPLFDAALFTTLFAMIFCWVPFFGNVLGALSAGMVTAGLAWIGWLSTWRFGYWFFMKPAGWQLWTYYGFLGLILWLSRVKAPMKKAALGACFLCWAFTTVSMLRVDHLHRFRLTVLASGKEPVLHSRFSEGADWLVNTGRNFPSDQGERLILPYLRQLGIKQMDGILLTDFYKKHRGGLEAILRDVSVRRILFPATGGVPADFNKLVKTLKGRTGILKDGMRLDFGKEKMTVLVLDERGMALLIEAVSQKVLFISAPAFFTAENVVRADPDLIIFPFLKGPVPEEILGTILQRPRILVFAGGDPAAFQGLRRAGVRYADLTATGAISITEADGKFLISSYLKQAV